MAARPNQAQLLQPHARPGNASVQDPGTGGGAGNGRGGRGRGVGEGGTGIGGAGAADESVSQHSRSMGDSASITIIPAVRACSRM